MSDLNDELVKAVDLALDGDWEAAHGMVQQYENDAMAAWIHAVLHKMEGDEGNSRYWYRRANRMERVEAETRGELMEIRQKLVIRG